MYRDTCRAVRTPLPWRPTSGIAIYPCKKANRNLVIQTNIRGEQGRGDPEAQPVPCRSMYVSRYCGTAVQAGRARTTHELTAWGISQPHAVLYYYHSRPSPAANLPLLKLRLALSGSGSRNHPLHMLVPCNPPRLLLSLRCAALRFAVLPGCPALLLVALAASECCYLLACPL